MRAIPTRRENCCLRILSFGDRLVPRCEDGKHFVSTSIVCAPLSTDTAAKFWIVSRRATRPSPRCGSPAITLNRLGDTHQLVKPCDGSAQHFSEFKGIKSSNCGFLEILFHSRRIERE